jgi:hypothetical protein
MVTMEQNEFKLNLQLMDTKGMPLSFFDQTTSELRQILTSIEEKRFGGISHANWLVDTDRLQITASVNGLSAQELTDVLTDAYQGIQASDTGDDGAFPASFDDATRKTVKRMVSRVKKISPLTKIESVGQNPLYILRPEQDTVRRHRKETYSAWSSIDGKLDVISVHHQPSFVIFEHGSQQAVHCTFPDSWMSTVKDYLGLRVITEGYVHYNEKGLPTSLSEPTSLEKVPDPRQEDILAYRGSMPGISGGLSSYEYVRQLRESNA